MSMVLADSTVRRKVTASGVIWLDGKAYYVSRRLAGRSIPVTIDEGKIIVDVLIPLRKEYRLPRGPRSGENGRNLRNARALA